ncbi:TlpA family protein disulfide reductase [Maritalea sp.]|uniref:TlpA family protein disulfide reductase n=1 Tax=Maritalea sp. TaxID=2003361 RepID=UPI003EF2EBDF
MRQILIKFSVVMALLLSVVGSASATDYVDYSPAVLAKAEQSGKPYLLDFYASWCGTCRQQENVLGNLQSADARYRDVQIIRVDWDNPISDDVIAWHKIPRRSTLVIFKGKDELGRVVAQTSAKKIQTLLELGL